MQRTTSLPVISSTLSSVIFAVLPKCPACLVLLLAPLGIKVPGTRWFLAYLLIMLAGMPLAYFWTPSCRKCGTAPLFLALGGLILMTIGRIGADNLAIVAIGAGAMFAAALWTGRLTLRRFTSREVQRCES